MRFPMLLIAVALALNGIAAAADNLDEGQAIRRLERLGGVVNPDDRTPGRPVTMVGFRFGSDFGDVDVPLLKAFPSLKSLDFRHTKISGTHILGAGLKELRGLKNLKALNLTDTRIGDGALKEIGGLKNLTVLVLTHTQITDAGLQELRQLTNLTILVLGSRQIRGSGLKELRELKNLRSLSLVGTQIAGAGLRDLGALEKLTKLDLSGTPINDAGLRELKDSQEPGDALSLWYADHQRRLEGTQRGRESDDAFPRPSADPDYVRRLKGARAF